MLDAGLTIFGARDGPRTPLDVESEDSDKSVASDPSVNMVMVYERPLILRITLLTISMDAQNSLTPRSPRYDAHAPPISLAYLRSPLRPFGMPFLNFSSKHQDAVARALGSSRSPARSGSGDGLSNFGSDSARFTGSDHSGGDDGSAIIRAALDASLT